MTTFTDKDGNTREVTKVTKKHVYAKKVNGEGKAGKGRPGKFNKEDLEKTLGVTFEVTEVEDVVTEKVETEESNAEQPLVNAVSTLPLPVTQPQETFVSQLQKVFGFGFRR